MGMFSPDENGWVREEEYNQLKESNETLHKMILILNDKLEEYKRTYGEL